MDCRFCLFAVLVVALASQAHAQPSAPLAEPGAPTAPSTVLAPKAAPNLQLRAADYRANELELQTLLHQRPSLLWPIATTAVGGAVAYGAFAWIDYIEAYRFLHGSDSISTRPVRPLYITTAVAAVVAGAGVFWLIKTLRRRRETDARIRTLQLSIPSRGDAR